MWRPLVTCLACSAVLVNPSGGDPWPLGPESCAFWLTSLQCPPYGSFQWTLTRTNVVCYIWPQCISYYFTVAILHSHWNYFLLLIYLPTFSSFTSTSNHRKVLKCWVKMPGSVWKSLKNEKYFEFLKTLNLCQSVSLPLLHTICV